MNNGSEAKALDRSTGSAIQNVIVGARVREIAKHRKVSSDFIEKLNDEVTRMIVTACNRCDENGRVTLKPQDV